MVSSILKSILLSILALWTIQADAASCACKPGRLIGIGEHSPATCAAAFENAKVEHARGMQYNGVSQTCSICYGSDWVCSGTKDSPTKRKATTKKCVKTKKTVQWAQASMSYSGRPKDGKPWACQGNKICWLCPSGYSWGAGDYNADIAAGRSVQCGKTVVVPDCP